MKTPRYICTEIRLSDRSVSVYAGKHVAEALRVITALDLYQGVKLLELLGAIYDQGKKDGTRDLFEEIDRLKNLIPHRNPGAPKKLKKIKLLKVKK